MSLFYTFICIFLLVCAFVHLCICIARGANIIIKAFLGIYINKMPFAPELKTHAQRVCTLYKRAMRTIEAYYGARFVVRYHQVILRNQFDVNKCVSDPKDQRRLLRVGEHELFMKQPGVPCMKFPRSYGIAGGVAPERVVTPPDWVLDYWHPLEKAQYPEYFYKRECRKCEFIQKWYSGTLN